MGIDADEAGYLAEFLDRDECAQPGPVPLQAGPRPQLTLPEPLRVSAAELRPRHLISGFTAPS